MKDSFMVMLSLAVALDVALADTSTTEAEGSYGGAIDDDTSNNSTDDSSYKSCVFMFPNVCVDTRVYNLFLGGACLLGIIAVIYLIIFIACFIILRRYVRLPFTQYFVLFNWTAEATRNFLDDPNPGNKYFRAWLCNRRGGYEAIPDHDAEAGQNVGGTSQQRQSVPPGNDDTLDSVYAAAAAFLAAAPPSVRRSASASRAAPKRSSGFFARLWRRFRGSSPSAGARCHNEATNDVGVVEEDVGEQPGPSGALDPVTDASYHKDLASISRSSQLRRKIRKQRMKRKTRESAATATAAPISSSDMGDPSSTSNGETGRSAMDPDAPIGLGTPPVTDIVSSTLRSVAATRISSPSVPPLPPRCASAPVPETASDTDLPKEVAKGQKKFRARAKKSEGQPEKAEYQKSKDDEPINQAGSHQEDPECQQEEPQCHQPNGERARSEGQEEAGENATEKAADCEEDQTMGNGSHPPPLSREESPASSVPSPKSGDSDVSEHHYDDAAEYGSPFEKISQGEMDGA